MNDVDDNPLVQSQENFKLHCLTFSSHYVCSIIITVKMYSFITPISLPKFFYTFKKFSYNTRKIIQAI